MLKLLLPLVLALAACASLDPVLDAQDHTERARAFAQLVVDIADGEVIPPQALAAAELVLADAEAGGEYHEDVLELAHAVRTWADGGAPVPRELVTMARLVLVLLPPPEPAAS